MNNLIRIINSILLVGLFVAFQINPVTSATISNNLVYNGDFETSLSGWYIDDGTASRSSEDVQNGSFSMKVVSEILSSNVTVGIIRSVRIKELSDTTYSLSTWLKKNITGDWAAIELCWFENGGTIYQGRTDIEFKAYIDDWVEITWKGTKWNASTDECEIRFNLQDYDGDPFHYYVDAVWFGEDITPSDSGSITTTITTTTTEIGVELSPGFEIFFTLAMLAFLSVFFQRKRY